MLFKPRLVPCDSGNHEYLWNGLLCRTRNVPALFAWPLGLHILDRGRAVLDEIAILKVENLEQELNLREIMLRNLILDLSSQRTLDLDLETIFSDTIRGSPKKGILGVLNKPDLVSLPSGPFVVQVTGDWLEERPVRRRGVSGPGLF